MRKPHHESTRNNDNDKTANQSPRNNGNDKTADQNAPVQGFQDLQLESRPLQRTGRAGSLERLHVRLLRGVQQHAGDGEGCKVHTHTNLPGNPFFFPA